MGQLPKLVRVLLDWVIPSYALVELAWIAVMVLGLASFNGEGGLFRLWIEQQEPATYYDMSIALVACIGFLL